MTREEYRQALIPHWERCQQEYAAAWALYPTGFYNFQKRAAEAGREYSKIAAELWKAVELFDTV